MPRSSRHKSSKHSSREVRDYSDSEKDKEKEIGLKEKRGRDDSRHLKESISNEKRKNESKSMEVSKDLSGGGGGGGGGGVIVDEYGASSSLSKKRKEKEKEKEKEKDKEKEEDDRWTGGDWDGIDLSKSDSKRLSRREESSGVGFDGEEGKRSGSKVESKHHRSERKERGEKEGGGSERERKSSKGERLVEAGIGNENVGSEGGRKHSGGDDHGGKHGGNSNNNSNTNNTEKELRNPEPEKEIDRRVKRKRDGSGDGDKHQDGARELDDGRLSRDDMPRSGKYKDEAHKDERIRDRHQEDVDSWHQDDKQRDNRATREYTSGRSEEKHLRNDKKDLDVSQKKSKAHGNEYDREADRERDRDRDRARDHNDRDRGRERDRERDRSRHERERDRDRDRENDDRDHDHDRDRDQERDPERMHNREPERERERGRDRDRYHRERDRERIRDRDHNHDRTRERDYDHDHDYASHVDDKGSRYKDDRGRRRSPDVYDDYHGDKSRKVELEADKDRPLSRKNHLDNLMGSSRRKASPSSRTYVSTDKYRDGIQDETKYGDSLRDGAASEIPDKVPKYRSGEKRTKFDENHIGELSERSPNTKASPAGIKERSPSASIDRRFQNRNTRRRSLDVDDAERKSSGSNDIRDAPINEDRQVREFSTKKPSGEEYPRAESPFHHKSSQGNMSSHGPGSSGFRSGADSPSFMGSLGDDSRGHSGSRYRRSVDPNVGRGPGSAWKGAPNWPSPLPNGFLPYPPGPPGPHGPHHGGFPTMLSQFPPFGVRPSLDMNHLGMPYHMGDGDRFSGHVRPIGWQNMVDGPVPPHFHGWDVSNSLLRDDPGMYGPGHLANAQRRDMNVDMWKSNGDVNVDFTSASQKESQLVKASTDEVSSAQGASRPHVENSFHEEETSLKKNTPSGPSSTKDILMTPAKVTSDKTPESSSIDDSSNSVRAYLAKLDISMDMADAELYNQFINLAVKGDPECVEEVEVEYIEDNAVAKSEIGGLTVGSSFFPVVKDSIFQKAMDLYKRQSGNKSSLISDGDKLPSDPTSHPEFEHTSVLEEKVDSLVDLDAKKAEPSVIVPEAVSTTPVVEGKETASIVSSDEALNDGRLPSAEMAIDLVGQVVAPALTVEKMDEDVGVDKELLLVEGAHSDASSDIKTDPEMIGNDGKPDGGGFEPASNKPSNTGVSGDLVMSEDSVKVCEPLNLVSNESDSGILSRIHHAPESTH